MKPNSWNSGSSGRLRWLREPASLLLLAFLTLALSTAPVRVAAVDAPADSPSDANEPRPGGGVLSDTPLLFDTNLGLIERTTMQAVQEALEGITLDPGSDIRLHAMTTNEGGWFIEDCIARVLSQKGYRVHLASAAGTAPATTPGTGSAGTAAPGPQSLAEAMGRTSAPDSAGPGGAAAGASTPGAGTSGPPAGTGEEGTTTVVDPARSAQTQKDMLAQARAAGNSIIPADPPEAPVNPLPEGEGLVLSFRIIEFGVTYHGSWRRGFMGPRMVERLAAVNLYTRLVNGSAEDVLWVGRGRAERLDVVPKSKLDLLEGRNYPFQKPELRGRPLSRLAEPVLVSGIIAGLVFLFYSSQN